MFRTPETSHKNHQKPVESQQQKSFKFNMCPFLLRVQDDCYFSRRYKKDMTFFLYDWVDMMLPKDLRKKIMFSGSCLDHWLDWVYLTYGRAIKNNMYIYILYL